MTKISSIGPTSVVIGDVTGKGDLEIAGRVEGDTVAEGSLLLEAGAYMQGDLTAARIGIDEGARVRGSIRTLDAVGDEEDEAAGDEEPESLSEPPGGQERRRRDRRRRRGHGGLGAPPPPPPLPQHALHTASDADAPSVASRKPPVQPPPRAPEPTSERAAPSPRPQRTGPPAPVVPALAKGARGRRRPGRELE